MISKETFIKAMSCIRAEYDKQEKLWDELEDSFINVDKLINRINLEPMVDMLAMIVGCDTELIWDNLYDEQDDAQYDRLYDYIAANEVLPMDEENISD